MARLEESSAFIWNTTITLKAIEIIWPRSSTLWKPAALDIKFAPVARHGQAKGFFKTC